MIEHKDDATIQGDDNTETTPQFRETMTEHTDDATVQMTQRRRHNTGRR